MERPRRKFRDAIVVVSIVVAIALLVIAAGFAFFGWDSTSPPPSPPFSPLPHLSITFAADTNAEIDFLLSSARPYIEPGDAFDLVVGSPNGSVNTSTVNQRSSEMSAAFPGDTIYAHTSGIGNYSTVASSVRSNISGVLYDYEPNYEPEFTFNFSQTVANFDNVTTVALAHGLLSVGYPTGRPILGANLQQYDWNYATLGGAVDRLIIQSQLYCQEGTPEFANATNKVLQQYAAGGLTSLPTFQITIGNSTTLLPHGVTAVPAYDCAEQLTDEGLHSLYVWWDEGSESDLLEFLQDIGRT